jgi:hypothetical protein
MREKNNHENGKLKKARKRIIITNQMQTSKIQGPDNTSPKDSACQVLAFGIGISFVI